MQICKCELLNMCTIVGWDRSKSNAFLSVWNPPWEIRQANLWKYRVFASHQRCLIPESFHFYQRGKLFFFTTSLTVRLPHPSGAWLWVIKVFRCAYYVVSQFSCRLLWSNKASEQSWCVAAIAAWHTSEKCQRSGADKVGVNSWLTQSPLSSFTCLLSFFSPPCSHSFCFSLYFPVLRFHLFPCCR